MNTGYWTSKPPAGVRLSRSHPLGGMAGCWSMQEGSGSRVNDLGPRQFHGTFNDAVACDWRPGKTGRAYRPATTSGLNTGTGAALGTGTLNALLSGAAAFTFCTRVLIQATGGGATFASGVLSWLIDGAGSNGGYAGFAQTTNAPFISGRSQSADAHQDKTSSRSLNLNQWYDVAFLWDITGDRLNIAVNGALEAWTTATFGQATYTPGAPTAPDNLGDIAGANNFGSLAGLMEYGYLYPRLLSERDLHAIAAAPYQMFEPPAWRRLFGAFGPTRLFIRDRASQGVPAYRDLSDSRGAAMVTGAVSTNASTEKQWTKTTSGAVLTWISGPVPAGGFTLSRQMTFNIWALESANTANAGARARVFKWSGGVETEVAGGPWNRGVEFTTSATLQNWTGTPSSAMAFVQDDRLVVKFYITNIGTMGAGAACTMDYDGPTSGADGDAWLEIAEGVTFGPPEPFPPWRSDPMRSLIAQ